MKVTVVGLGRLGSPMAAVFAASGMTVVGVDVSAKTVEALNEGRAPVTEPGLEEMLARAGSRLRATNDFATALKDAAMSFVVVPTPSGDDGMFTLDWVLAAVKEIGSALRFGGGRRHVVVITSTVMPGSTAGAVRAALESASGLTVGDGVGLCYSPEFIALGSVITDLTRPDMVLVGESDTASGDLLISVLATVSGREPAVARMDPTSAEVAKLAVNTFVTTKISYANMLGEICERLPGADAHLVAGALGLDSRIGPKYLKPGAPFGGPCFPRDNAALAALARSLGGRADIAEATDTINRRQVERVMALLRTHRGRGNRVATLGLSYKPGTPVRDESFGVTLAADCAKDGFEVIAWDPMCRIGSLSPLLNGISVTDSLAECADFADLAVVTTPWPELQDLPSIISELGQPKVVIDCWQLLKEFPADRGTLLVQLGQGPRINMDFAEART